MPCFKGLAVSIHTPEGPLSEYAIQKQSRASRISSYIAVPPAKVPVGSTTGKPEQSGFAISITLLTPGMSVPYSTPKPTSDNPYPRPRLVGGLPSALGERGRYGPPIPPYLPRTQNPNETIAAYIYFDGRAKEEVATLLRRGEETWVNSRWVSVPESEGGGLAERDFLFREVGLERWLNGLDLEGSKDKAERIERRHRRLEKSRRRRKERVGSDDDDDDAEVDAMRDKRVDRNGVLRYGGEDGSPVEDMPLDNGLLSSGSDSDSEDEPPKPEAAGQIKVALFRVLASGEIKRGEYSPQFGAHDDDEGMDQNGGGEDIDHTTSFAKPKTLDPKTISTQTVTGLDPPEAPYAVFTFFYRGGKQLQKMGILPNTETQKTPQSTNRKSTDFANLGPLKSFGTVGFSGYRDPSSSKRKEEKRTGDAMDSDAEEEEEEEPLQNEKDEADVKQENGNLLSPEDAKRQGEISEGVQKIKLKRQHSAEPLADPTSTRKSPHLKTEDSPGNATPQSVNSTSANPGTPPDNASPPGADAGEVVASPYKRHRASAVGLESSVFSQIGPLAAEPLLPAVTTTDAKPEGTGAAPASASSTQEGAIKDEKLHSDEEL